MTDPSASSLIDDRIASFNDWRGATLARMRALIQGAVALNGAQKKR